MGRLPEGATWLKWRVVQVGSEPMVLWGRDDESDLPRVTILMRDWRFESPYGGVVHLGCGSMIGAVHATFVSAGYEPLVPSDEPPDIENGAFVIAGWSIAELRDLALKKKQARGRWWKRILWPRR